MLYVLFQRIFLLIVLFLCIGTIGCDSANKKQQVTIQSCEIVDLDESAQLIISLVGKQELYKVLEENSSKESIGLLIKNFSPAEMAFEAEVLSQDQPVVVAYFKEQDPQWPLVRTILIKLADKYRNSVKFVEINADVLFKLVEKANIEIFPSISVIYNREEIGYIEPVAVDVLELSLEEMIKLNLSP